MLPDELGSYPHELVQVGKEGRIVVLNRDALGGFAGAAATSNTNALQDISGVLQFRQERRPPNRQGCGIHLPIGMDASIYGATRMCP